MSMRLVTFGGTPCVGNCTATALPGIWSAVKVAGVPISRCPWELVT